MSLYLITDGGELRVSKKLVGTIQTALVAGQGFVEYLQIREQVTEKAKNKPASDNELTQLIDELSPICQEYKCKLLVNRRVELLYLKGLSGVHLGKDSISKLSPIESKPNIVIGYSAHCVKEAMSILGDYSRIDYLLFGPVFTPISKTSTRESLGLEELEKICSWSAKPIFAIGGISEHNIKACKSAGASGVACIGSVLGCKDPGRAVKIFSELWLTSS